MSEFKFYKPLQHPTGLTGTVGGGISTQLVSGYVGEVFAHASSPPSGTSEVFEQYRQVYIKNEYGHQLSNVRVYVVDAEHPEQISIGLASGLAQTTSSPTGAPDNVTFVQGYSYQSGISLGTLTNNSYSGVWIKIALSGIHVSDPYASFTLKAGGQAE